MMEGVSLNRVTPGPACVIPEEKKIFRVTAEQLDLQALRLAVPVSDDGDGDEVPPLPVPHMYSA